MVDSVAVVVTAGVSVAASASVATTVEVVVKKGGELAEELLLEFWQ